MTSHEVPIPPRNRVTAGAISFAVHVALFVGLGLLVRAAPRAGDGEPDRGTGIVLVEPKANTAHAVRFESDGAQAVHSAGDSGAPPSANVLTGSLASALPADSAMPADIAGVLPSSSVDASGILGLSHVPNGTIRTRRGRLDETGYQIDTSIFGARATGSRFVYVFDRSASMSDHEGRPMRAAKQELLANLSKLEDVHQFQILFYNDHITIFNPVPSLPPKMLYARKSEKAQAESFIRSIKPDGGTEHVEPLKLALKLSPDVIFFLTDADEPELSAAQLEDIRRRNNGTVLNTIEFGSGPKPSGTNFLQALANQNGGQYVYVDVETLP